MYHLVSRILLVSFLFFIIPEIAQAGFLDDISYCTQDGSCNFTDMAIAFSSLIQFLLGIMGAVALLFFVWGGIQWITSWGNAERVRRGSDIMTNTFFAIVLAFGSYLMVNFFVNDILGAKTDYRVEQGEYISCQEAAFGTDCGKYKQCTGVIEGDLSYLSNSCLYLCRAKAAKINLEARCVNEDSIPNGWKANADIRTNCPKELICAVNINNL